MPLPPPHTTTITITFKPQLIEVTTSAGLPVHKTADISAPSHPHPPTPTPTSPLWLSNVNATVLETTPTGDAAVLLVSAGWPSPPVV